MAMRIDIIDVFGRGPLGGNPLAVVHGGEHLDTAAMLRLTAWLGFSETTFLLPPDVPGADYHVRIFCPGRELPFAGHPTLGSCHAWLAAGGRPAGEAIVQQCGVGLVPIRRIEGLLAFRAPPLRKGGPLSREELRAAIGLCHVPEAAVIEAVHADNGPGWQLLRLDSLATLLAAEPALRAPPGTDIGLIAKAPPGSDSDWELRAFFVDATGRLKEDPVTGSLNAAAALHLFGNGLAKARYVAAQGRKVGADGRVVCIEADGGAWVAGHTAMVAAGAALAI